MYRLSTAEVLGFTYNWLVWKLNSEHKPLYLPPFKDKLVEMDQELDLEQFLHDYLLAGKLMLSCISEN